MNKRKKILIIILITLGIALISSGYIIYNKTKSSNEKESEQTYEIDNKVNKFLDQSGNEITIEADKIVEATGFSGASNNKYYLRGTTLYFRDISNKDNKEEILAYNINNIYLENEYIIAEKLENTKILKENNYVKYKELETKNNYKEESQKGEEITIEADKLVTATGFSGSNNYKYYLRGTTLYFRDISSKDNKEEILAYNVEDLYLNNNEVTAKLSKQGNIVAYNKYITYIVNKTNKYTFNDQSGNEITIEADILVTATGFSGASNYKYYLRESTLYFKNISNSNNNEHILATNVKDLYNEGEDIIAVLDKEGQILEENQYIKYKN